MDIHQAMWAFPGKLRLRTFRGRMFLAKANPYIDINMDGVKAVLDTLSLRSDEQRLVEYVQAKESEFRHSEIILKLTEPRRIFQHLLYREIRKEFSTKTGRDRAMKTKSSANTSETDKAKL